MTNIGRQLIPETALVSKARSIVGMGVHAKVNVQNMLAGN